MKVLHLFDLFSPRQGGGTVFLLAMLLQGQARRGHQVELYTSDFELDRDYIAAVPEVRVQTLHCLARVANMYCIPGIVGMMNKHLAEFDILHLHTYRSFQNIVAHRYALKYKVPYVLDAHGSVPRMAGWKSGLKWMFDGFFGNNILRDARRIIAETETGMQEYRRAGAQSEKLVRITPPFSTEEYDQLPAPGEFRSTFSNAAHHIVMFVGRIHEIKGLDFLAEAFAELAALRDDVRLVIVGPDDGYRAELEKLIEKLEITNKVIFTGYLDGQEKLAALVDADVVVQTSRYEQGARVPLEAVMCGTPIIVTAHTGAGEEINELDAGYLVEFGNRGQLAALIDGILNDPTEGKRKAARAAATIRETRSINVTSARYEELYQECIAEARSSL